MLSTKSVNDPAIKACVGGSAAEVEHVWCWKKGTNELCLMT